MNFVDVVIIGMILTSLVRGHELGFVRQLLSTLGFFLGLFIGTQITPWLVSHVHTSASKAVVALLCTLGCAFLLLTVGEYVGIVLKNRLAMRKINFLDNKLGSVLAVISILIATWLGAAIVRTLPMPSLQSAIKDSAIITALNRHLPAAPTVVAELGHIIEPNGFPQVFLGLEPTPAANISLPELGALQPAVKADAASVVKIEGQGCGGIVEGSGFVAANNLVITNAHVVAGIRSPYVSDQNGVHKAAAVWFDPNLDLAILRVNGLSGKSLTINPADMPAGTPGAVLGFPGGGPFTAGAAAVLEQFQASGRNIYDQGDVTRSVYEIKADVIPGNSGGPLIGKDGQVIGVIFAQSTSYNHVGYALTTSAVISALHKADARRQLVSTGNCAD